MRRVRPRAAIAGARLAGWAIATAFVALVLFPAPADAQAFGDGLGDIQSLQPTPTPAPAMPPLPALEPLPLDGAPAGDAPADASGKKSRGGAAIPAQILLVLGVGALVIVATIFVVLAVVLKQPVVINVTSRGGGGPLGSDGPDPAEWIEGSMVRMGRPPEGTLKILPGRFVLDDGDRQIELRIFRTTGADRVETTIGRDTGPPYRHIQLKPLSVSAQHAKLVFENNVYSIINYSRTNPTLVNGEPLPENASRRLVDEDRVEIGEVVFTYHGV